MYPLKRRRDGVCFFLPFQPKNLSTGILDYKKGKRLVMFVYIKKNGIDHRGLCYNFSTYVVRCVSVHWKVFLIVVTSKNNQVLEGIFETSDGYVKTFILQIFGERNIRKLLPGLLALLLVRRHQTWSQSTNYGWKLGNHRAHSLCDP